jgi:hypothetical protein
MKNKCIILIYDKEEKEKIYKDRYNYKNIDLIFSKNKKTYQRVNRFKKSSFYFKKNLNFLNLLHFSKIHCNFKIFNKLLNFKFQKKFFLPNFLNLNYNFIDNNKKENNLIKKNLNENDLKKNNLNENKNNLKNLKKINKNNLNKNENNFKNFINKNENKKIIIKEMIKKYNKKINIAILVDNFHIFGGLERVVLEVKKIYFKKKKKDNNRIKKI